VRATITHLDAFHEAPPATIRIDSRVLLRDRSAVLVDPLLGYTLERVERRLERLGYTLADVAGAPIDTETLELALWQPRLEVDDVALAKLGTDDTDREAQAPPSTSSRLPIDLAILWQGVTEPDGSPARQLLSVARLLVPSHGAALSIADLTIARRMMQIWRVCSCTGEDSALLELARDVARG
jgi:hypothetical protein